MLAGDELLGAIGEDHFHRIAVPFGIVLGGPHPGANRFHAIAHHWRVLGGACASDGKGKQGRRSCGKGNWAHFKPPEKSAIAPLPKTLIGRPSPRSSQSDRRSAHGWTAPPG